MILLIYKPICFKILKINEMKLKNILTLMKNIRLLTYWKIWSYTYNGVIFMFVKTSSQSSFFDIENTIPGALPKDDWSYAYQKHILPQIDEDKFRHFYTESGGRPNAPIRTMVSILIFMGVE